MIYDNDDENYNNHGDPYDVGIAQDDENNYSTNLIQCVLSSSGTISIVNDCDPVGTNDCYMIRCYNSSPTISSMRPITSFTIPLYPSSSETPSGDRDTCVSCDSHNGDDTDLDLVPVHLSPITSIHLLLVATTSLLSSSLSSSTFSSLPVLDSSFVSYWLSYYYRY